MFTVTIGEILSDQPPRLDSPRPVYVVRDGPVVFYVGKSEVDAIDRIRTHCGRGGWSSLTSWSLLGEFIALNAPGSSAWQVDLMSLDECMPYVKKLIPMAVECDAQYAEIAMIRELHPHLNRTHNGDPMPLPDRYRE